MPRGQISKVSAHKGQGRGGGNHFYLVHDVHSECMSPVAIVNRDEG